MSQLFFPPKNQEKPKPGASSALIGKIDYVHTILKNLPASLPLDPPESTFFFGLDPDDLEDGGVWMALNKNLETCFQRHLHANEASLKIQYRSSNFGALIKILKEAVKKSDDTYRKLIEEVWIDRILATAKEAGGTSAKRRTRKPSSSALQARNVRPCESLFPAPPVQNNELDSDIELVDVATASSSTPQAQDVRPHETLSPTPPACNDELDSDIELVDVTIPSSARVQNEISNANVRQSKITFPKLTKDAAIAQSKREFKNESKQREVRKKIMEREKAAKEARSRELARLRALKFRAAKKEKKEVNVTRHQVTLVPDASGSQDQGTTFDVAAISHEATGNWKNERNGKKGGTVEQAHKKTNYYHPFLWQLIQKTATRYQLSAARTTKALQNEYPALFSRLNKGTMHRWLEPDAVPARWSIATLNNVERYRALAGKGQAGVLSRYPDVLETAKTTLTSLRKNGIPLSVILGHAILISIIEEKNPEILLGIFKCSETFMRNFFSNVLGMSPRRATRAAAHIPANSDEVCERAFFRLVNIIKLFDIPLSLVINMDQTGVIYIPGFKCTFETKGSKQVNVIGKDEKRGFTLCVSSTADGRFLPFQQVCSGKTLRSCPDAHAEGMDTALSLGCHFMVAASEKNPSSHYSTLETMKQYMDKIFRPHYEQVLRDNPRLPRNQHAVLYLDAYPVHLSKAFLTFLEERHPYVSPVFVPANCTGIFQPADVGLQRVIKHIIKQVFLEELVKTQREQLSQGVALESVKFSNSISVLRNASVKAIVSVFDYMNSSLGQQIVQMAWRKCAVKTYNLSSDKLTDPNIRLNDLEAYLEADKVLSDEIAARKKTQIIISTDVEGEIADKNYNETNEDDTVAPLSSVVASALKIKIPARCSRYCTHSDRVKESDTGLALVPSSEEEDIYAFNDDGIAWGEGGLPAMQ